MKITYDRTIAALLSIAGPMTLTQIRCHTGICSDGARKALAHLLEDHKIKPLPTELTGKMGRPPVCYTIQESRS